MRMTIVIELLTEPLTWIYKIIGCPEADPAIG
jgi:hypothetical protein